MTRNKKLKADKYVRYISFFWEKHKCMSVTENPKRACKLSQVGTENRVFPWTHFILCTARHGAISSGDTDK